MITEIIRYQINPQDINQFVDSYLQAMVIVDETGFALDWEILQQDDDQSLFLIIIRWKSAEAHMQGFRKANRFADFFALIKPWLPAILEMKHYSNRSEA